MLAASRDLAMIEVQFRFIGPLYQHPTAPCPSPDVLSKGKASLFDC
jgi:hypothetical protein